MIPVRRLLVTGGAGFIGSNFIRHILDSDSDVSIVNVDKLTYAGNLENLADVEGDPRYTFLRADIADLPAVDEIFRRFAPDAVINFAAESHVDRSVLSSAPFVETNIRGTWSLLETARTHWAESPGTQRFVQISTDEVYGDLGPVGRFREDSPLAPNNPYAASKASADLLCRAYNRTYGLPGLVTRCSNSYGPFQFTEKLIPLMISRATRNERLPVYGDGSNVRDWIHVQDHCRAIETVLRMGQAGEIYNVGAGMECTNLDLVRELLRLLDRSEELIDFVRDRPGHDRRYAIDSAKLRAELGWSPVVPFTEGLSETVRWYRSHPEWTDRCLTGEYREYYDRNYGSSEAPA